MEAKKVSFGFKSTAKPNMLKNKLNKETTKDKEFIKCLERKEIQLVSGKPSEAHFVIPVLTNQKTSKTQASLLIKQAVSFGGDIINVNKHKTNTIAESSNTKESCNSQNLEQRAASEILAQAERMRSNNVENEKLILPFVAHKTDELPLNGGKEPSMKDYESIPIKQFGLAMLRGMGWVETPTKKKSSLPLNYMPILRTKGMGLGADKALKPNPLLLQPEVNEALLIRKYAYVRIIGGKHKNMYGQIEGFDDYAGRVIVKMAIGGIKETFNEYLCQPVAKKEYEQYSKCINTNKYEKYKMLGNKHGNI